MKKTAIFFGLMFLAVSVAHAEMTLETGDASGQLFFLWQDRLTKAGATSHRISEMSGFNPAYAKGLLEEIEILEVRELDTDQLLKFNYVLPPRSPFPPKLQDVVWYYPNPIPSGGRVRVQIRGRISAPKVFNWSRDRIEITFSSGESVFAIIPLGFALTYCNSPIIVYEKNGRTVCSFQSGEISLIAKNVSALAATGAPPTIPREAVGKAMLSRLPITVSACEETRILQAAQRQLSGSQPVVLKDVSKEAMTAEDFQKLKPNTTLVWKVNDVIVVGLQGFNFISGHLVIGSNATLYLAEPLPDGNVKNMGSASVRVLPSDR